MKGMDRVNNNARLELAHQRGFTRADVGTWFNLGQLQKHRRQGNAVLDVRPGPYCLNSWQMPHQMLLDRLVKLIQAKRFVSHYPILLRYFCSSKLSSCLRISSKRSSAFCTQLSKWGRACSRDTFALASGNRLPFSATH